MVSLDDFGTTTNFSASLACISNIDPGRGLVGPTGSFAMLSYVSKIALTFAMLIGRLELYPILLLFSRHT